MGYILGVNGEVLSLGGVKGVCGDMKMDEGGIFVGSGLGGFVG